MIAAAGNRITFLYLSGWQFHYCNRNSVSNGTQSYRKRLISMRTTQKICGFSFVLFSSCRFPMIFCFSCQNDFLLKLYFITNWLLQRDVVKVANVRFFSLIWNIFKFDIEFFAFFRSFNDDDSQTKGPSDDAHCSAIIEWNNLAFEFFSAWAVLCRCQAAKTFYSRTEKKRVTNRLSIGKCSLWRADDSIWEKSLYFSRSANLR